MTQDRNAASAARPFTARSVVLSTLLGTHPPVLPVRVLVRAGELFGIPEGTIRVALSRMAAAGEVAAADGSYGLAGRLLERQARQAASLAGLDGAGGGGGAAPWSGEWRFCLVVGSGARSAADRGELRAALRALRLAELREGVWLRPDNLPWSLAAAPGSPVAAQCLVAVGRLDGEDPAAVASRLWDLDGWARRAAELRQAMAASLGAVAAGSAEALAPGFVLSADVLRHLQADPLLPAELLPEGWPGAALRAEYAGWDDAYRRLLRTWWQA
jgi:phenylacetic acid degradation operon negative regulatory protein